MENVVINDVLVAYDDLMYPKFKNEKMVVYKLTFADGSSAIGGTSLNLMRELKNLCKNVDNSAISKKIQYEKHFKVDILARCKDIRELKKEKQYAELINNSSMQESLNYIYNHLANCLTATQEN